MRKFDFLLLILDIFVLTASPLHVCTLQSWREQEQIRFRFATDVCLLWFLSMYLLSFLGGRYAEFVCLLTFVVRYGLIASILSMLGHTYNKVDSALFAPINNGRHHQTCASFCTFWSS